MRTFKTLSVVIALGAPMAASAGASNHLDVYYVSTDLDLEIPAVGSVEDDGDGFGLRGEFAVADAVFLSAEYQSAKLDDSDEDFQQIRLGIGGLYPVSPELVVVGRAEYVDAEIDNSDVEDDGPAVHVGLRFAAGALSLNGSVGYLKLGDSDGPEFLAGAAFALSEAVGLFADYRLTSLELDDSGGAELDINDLRVGVRFSF